MKKVLGFMAVLFLLQAGSASAQDGNCAAWLDVEVNKLNSSEVVDLCSEIQDKPVLLVNTASYCGFTYQFTGLEELYQRYKDRGLAVVGFPSDDFNQEDDDAGVTAEVCYVNHGVTFPMTEVVKVKGNEAHPVFAHLGVEGGEPTWNFNKYLVDAQGNVVEHFDSRVEPDSDTMNQAIESVL